VSEKEGRVITYHGLPSENQGKDLITEKNCGEFNYELATDSLDHIDDPVRHACT
jgi:hypothetical protein